MGLQLAHEFTILFNLKQVPVHGEGGLRLDVLETHPSAPAVLTIRVNDRLMAVTRLRNGSTNAEAVAGGDYGKAAPQVVQVPVPATILKAGVNPSLNVPGLVGNSKVVWRPWTGLGTSGAIDPHSRQILYLYP